VISVTAQGLGGGVGFITSQGREHPNETNGFVFKHLLIAIHVHQMLTTTSIPLHFTYKQAK